VPNQLYPEYKGPYGGYLSGASDVINAQGNFMVQEQQAGLMVEQKRQSKVDTRRKQIDEWQYERAVLPTPEDERERARLENVRRSRGDPPITEIWSGKTLNDLLKVFQKVHATGARGPYVPLHEGITQHINVSSGAAGRSLSVLRGGPVRWPLSLQEPPFQSQCRRIDQLAPTILQQAQSGTVDAKTLRDLNEAQEALVRQLKGNVANMSANDYIEAKRYLNDLEVDLRALRDPNIANFVTHRWSAQAGNVAELVLGMTSQGLQFAPAAVADQPAYTALHHAMITYDSQLGLAAARP
jgi:hypothetical protein